MNPLSSPLPGGETPERRSGKSRKPAPVNTARRSHELSGTLVSEALLRTVFDKAPTGVGVADSEGRFIALNPALERMLGYSADEWTKRRLADTVHPDDREKVAEANRGLFSGELDELVFEHRFLHKNGETVWARVSVSLVRDKKKAPFRLIAIIEDISERKRAEGNAATADALTETLLETTDALVVQLNGSGEIEFVNGAFEEITGYKREDLESESWFEVLVPKDRYPEVWEEFQRLTAGGIPVRFENPILTKTGEERYIVWRNSALRRRDGTVGTVSIGIDVTESKRAEAELRDSEEKLLAVFMSAPVAIGVADPSDGRIYDVNREYERMFECSYDDVVGKTSTELGLWADPNDRQIMVNMIERDGKVEDLELSLRTRKGRELLVHANALPVTVAGVGYIVYTLADVGERRRAEEQIAMLKQSIDVHTDGAYWMDTSNSFIYVNEAGYRALGYESDELLGKPVSLVNTTATPERMEEVWERLRADGAFSAESVHRRKDGSEFPVEITSSYVQFGGKEYNCGFAHDISERKRAEAERELLAEELLRAQKMQAVGKLAGGVAHSFNNILTALVGYCELLLAKLPVDSEYRSDAEEIKRAADHATTVTRELLLFSRREAGRLTRLDLNAVIVQTRLLLRQLLRSDIEIVTALAPTVALVEADRSQIEQVLVNLFLNASDAMPNGGAIAVETADVEVEEAISREDATIEAGQYVTLTVKDSGSGMDEETRAHIFEPFFTTKGHEGSVGLGLSTVSGIVEESGGQIVVDSEPGKGSRFTIYLPALSGRRQAG